MLGESGALIRLDYLKDPALGYAGIGGAVGDGQEEQKVEKEGIEIEHGVREKMTSPGEFER